MTSAWVGEDHSLPVCAEMLAKTCSTWDGVNPLSLSSSHSIISGEASSSSFGIDIVRAPSEVAATRPVASLAAALIRRMAPSTRSAVVLMLSTAEGLISSRSGRMLRRILFRCTSSTRFEESVMWLCPIVSRYSVISLRVTQSRGRNTSPLTGTIPLRPSIPVPRTRLRRSVSTESFLWCATSIPSRPRSRPSCLK